MKFIILIFFIFTGISSFSQSRERLKEKTFTPDDFEEFKVEIKPGKKQQPLELNCNSVYFIDGRADTSKLGFALAGSNTEYHRIVFPKAAAGYINEKIIPFFTGGSPDNGGIAFVVKHLWVSEMIVKAGFGKSLLTGPLDYLSFCYLNADCYSYQKEQYTLLGTVDTVVSLRKWIVNAADDLIEKTLIGLLKTGDSLFTVKKIKNDPVSYNELVHKIHADFDFPIIKSLKPNKGIYLTYNDFLNDSPAITDFSIAKNKKTEYLTSPGKADSVFKNAWGYYDGNDFNIHINDNYYRMTRSQNTFEIAGPRKITKLYTAGEKILNTSINAFFTGIIGGGFTLLVMGSNEKILKELVPYQLNIRDGVLY